MSVTWKVTTRKWATEKKLSVSQTTANHPLQGVKERTLKQSGSAMDSRSKPSVPQHIVLDPLLSALDGPDPLSDLLGVSNPLSGSSFTGSSHQVTESGEDAEAVDAGGRHVTWDQQKVFLLANFTTTGTLTFTSSFLQPSDSAESRAVPAKRRVVKTQSAITERQRTQGMSGSERIKARLEQLDSLDEVSGRTVREVGGLTQEEFTHRLSSMKQELTSSWHSNQRVKALKIAIQCVKLLNLAAPEHFYPSKFVLVTDVLDTLAHLVLQRLKQKSGESQRSSTSSDVDSISNQEAQETTRNWFYKVASIRELLPRLYLEAALLPCYSLISVHDGEQALARLSRMIRGIGDPLVAAYARMFVCRIGAEIAPTLTQYISESIEDFLQTLKQGLWPEGEADVNMGEDKDVLAARVLAPPLQWMMQCLACRAPHHVLQSVLRQCEGSEGLGQNLLVATLLTTFPHHFIAQQAVPLTHLIAGCSHPGKSQHELLSSLGVCVNHVPPPQQQQLALLNAVWKLITRIPDTKHYLSTGGVWLEYTAKYFTATEVNTLLGDVLKHIGSDRNQGQIHYPALLTLISTALTNSPDPHPLFAMNHFQGMLSVFQRDTVSTGEGVTRGVTEALLTHHPGDITDPTLVQHLLTLCGALHDSINALTTDDEKRQLSQLITSFIRQVNFGRDFEQQLDFYVNARAAFSNLDTVLIALVQCVCQLGMATWNVMRGQHSGKTAAFVRACSAYCFITIPSLTSPETRLKMYILSGTVALINNCLGQGDACMKAAIREVLEMANSQGSNTAGQTSDILRQCVATLSSVLIAIPDPPDASPPLYLLRGLTNAVRSHNWQKDTDLQAYLSIALLHALSAAAQDTLPYHISTVEGNDSLYGGDPMVLQEAEQLCSTLLQDVLSHIQGLTGIHEKRCGPLSLALLWCLLTWCDLSHPQIMDMATPVWSLMVKHNSSSVVSNVKGWITARSAQRRDTTLNKFLKL